MHGATHIKTISLICCVQTSCLAHSGTCPLTGDAALATKRLQREADRSALCGTELKNASSYALLPWCLITHGDSFTLTLYLAERWKDVTRLIVDFCKYSANAPKMSVTVKQFNWSVNYIRGVQLKTEPRRTTTALHLLILYIYITYRMLHFVLEVNFNSQMSLCWYCTRSLTAAAWLAVLSPRVRYIASHYSLLVVTYLGSTV